jgi:phosphatidylserine synthase 2
MFKYFPQVLFTAVLGPILYFGWQNKLEEPSEESAQTDARAANVRNAFIAIFCVFAAHRVFESNIKQLFKPFEMIWSINSNIVSMYLYVLVFIYFMNASDARQMWKYVESRLGVVITKEYHTYDDDCALTYDNLVGNVDHYFLAHFTNWFLAAMILRDAPLLHFWSILDEVLELSAQYKLPHFRECWWDHIFHDVLFTNTPGIILGLMVVNWLGLEKYDWLGRKGKASIFDWEIFNDFFRFGGIVQIYFIISMNFLTGFFMINALWVPPLSIPTVTRMYTWFIIGNIVFKEGWRAMQGRNNRRTRHQISPPNWRFVTFAIVFLEIAISFKFDENTGNLTDETMHPIIFYGWSIVAIAVVGFYSYLRWIRKTDEEFEEAHMTPAKSSIRTRSSAKKNR